MISFAIFLTPQVHAFVELDFVSIKALVILGWVVISGPLEGALVVLNIL